MPLISIITVNYNNAVGLERTIKSVQEQTMHDFEHIIIDGGSNDGSKDIIVKYKESFSYQVSEPDNGIYHAMNKGAFKANGKYLYFLNSGDHFEHKTSLESISKYFDDQDIIYSNIKVVNGESSRINYAPEELSFMYLINDLPCHQATFYRKEFFDKIGGYDDSLEIVADWNLFILSVLKFNAKCLYVNQVFSCYHADGVSSDPENYKIIQKEREQVLNLEFKILKNNDAQEIFRLRRVVKNLRKSRKIRWLIKFGFLDNF